MLRVLKLVVSHWSQGVWYILELLLVEGSGWCFTALLKKDLIIEELFDQQIGHLRQRNRETVFRGVFYYFIFTWKIKKLQEWIGYFILKQK